jgi:hypothetical protein
MWLKPCISRYLAICCFAELGEIGVNFAEFIPNLSPSGLSAK